MVTPLMVSLTGLASVGGGGGKVTPFPPSITEGLVGVVEDLSAATVMAQTQARKSRSSVIFIGAWLRIQATHNPCFGMPARSPPGFAGPRSRRGAVSRRHRYRRR